MLDAIVIGAGHAGLATAYLLKQQGYRKVIVLEADTQVGARWRKRYSGLTLFTSRQYSQLPGLAMSGKQHGYPSNIEFADYLETYKRNFDIQVEFNRNVVQLNKIGETFRIDCHDGSRYNSRMVFVCTGAFANPRIPNWRKSLTESIACYTPESLGRAHLKSKKENWLVVGDGASGRQIARFLAADNRVYLSCGKPRTLLPQTIFNRDIFYWLDKLGLNTLSKQHWLARRIRKKDPFPGNGISNQFLMSDGIIFKERFNEQQIDDKGQVIIDNQVIDNIVFAIGYSNSFEWLKSFVSFDDVGQINLNNGNTDTSGLYILSQPWLTSRGSGLILGIEHDFKLLKLLK